MQSPFIDNMWGAYVAHMQLVSKFSKEICFLLCVIDIFSNSLKDEKDITMDNAFQKNLKESNCKWNKLWVDKGNEIGNRNHGYKKMQ